jgi:hydroxyacyl-ACP dehydratase HTD2-like protein with hotdog domain
MASEGWGKQGSWEETESFLGKVIAVSKGVDAVEMGSIRRWLEPKQFYPPIHSDRAAADKAGYKDIVAPCTMAFTYSLPAYFGEDAGLEQLGDTATQIPVPVIFELPAPCIRSFATSVDIEFFADMFLGDRITCTHTLKDITYKTLKVGRGAFLTQEDSYTNQDDELVARSQLVIFRFNSPEDEKREEQKDVNGDDNA